MKTDYTEQRTKLRRRVTGLETRLKDMARLNRAYNLGRVPAIAARILRKLDQEGLLGKHLFVVARIRVTRTRRQQAWCSKPD